MNRIKVLDCTLRDGGYVNGWNFGRGAIYNIVTGLARAKIDIIEVGFLNQSYQFSADHSITPRSSLLPKIYDFRIENSPRLLAMIIMGECDISGVDPREESLVDGIRIVFKKNKIEEAFAFAQQVKQKGYKIFLQPASVTDYSDAEMKALAERVNALTPEAVYIVDTYGLMHKREVRNYFNILDAALSKGISIGYHSHNNLQLSYATAMDLLEIETEREVIMDATLFGIGKGSGNLGIELITDYLNKNMNKSYDTPRLLELIDSEILKIKNQFSWGYTLKGFIAASNSCHPEYVSYLLEKKTIPVIAINAILSQIPQEKKTTFHKDVIEKLYIKFQSVEIDDSASVEALRGAFAGRELLLLAPGGSLNRESRRINEFIENAKPVVISINHHPATYGVDYYFINNIKRYNQMRSILDKGNSIPMIVSSNVIEHAQGDIIPLNYSSLLVDGDVSIVSDNATLMLFNALRRAGISKVNIAGFDGFSNDTTEHYVDKYMSYNTNKNVEIQNQLIGAAVADIRRHLDVNFITGSRYLEVGRG